jgi:microcystin-dependent protein
MQSWFNYPKFRAVIPATGLPLNGGLLYFYQTGTAYAVEKTTYSDGALTTPHTNPVVLDSNGEALIYLSGVYDIKLTDSTGVLQWTMTGVEGINAFSFSTWEIDALTAYGAGTAYTKATIDAALADLGAVIKYTLTLRPGTWAYTVAADYSTYNNITFLTSPGTVITSTSTILFPTGSKFYLSNFVSLQAAVALLSTTKCTIIVNRDYAMTADATIPATMTLEFWNGAQITTTGYTLTFAAGASIDAGLWRIFAGSGTIVGPTGEVPLEWNNAGTSLSMAATVESYILDEDDMASDSATKVPSQQSVKAYVTASSPTTIAVGTIILWPTGTVPSGYLECDGSSLDTTTYADLYAVLGVLYGNADGTHFNLPDLRGRFPRFWDHAAGLDPGSRTDRGDGTAGDVVGTLQAEAFLAHEHTGSTATLTGEIIVNTNGSGGSDPADFLRTAAQTTQTALTQAVTPTIASDGGAETRPININLMAVIKY